MLEGFSFYLENLSVTITATKLGQFSEISMSSISESTSSTHTRVITNLTQKLENLKTDATAGNIKVDGVPYSNDVLTIHNLIKNHNAIYDVETSSRGKWTFNGMREIKKRGAATNPNFQLPDGVATFMVILIMITW